MTTTRVFDSIFLLDQAIRAAEAENNHEFVDALIKAKKDELWRRYNQRLLELTLEGMDGECD
jgi:ferritin-like protein